MLKKIIIFSVILFIVSSCTPAQKQMAIPTSSYVVKSQPFTCTEYSVTAWIKSEWDGSFSQHITYPAPNINSGGGTSANYVRLTQKEIDATLTLNINSVKDWKWAADAHNGLVFQSIDGIDIHTSVDWNRIAPASGLPEFGDKINYVCVSQVVNGFAELVGMPKGTDYQKYFNVRWVIQHIYGNYGGFPHLYDIVTWDACSGFVISKGECGIWVPVSILAQKIGTVNVPWNISATITPTSTFEVPTFTPTPTFTSTPSITLTPVITPTPDVVVYIIASPWLSMRPDPSMSNVPTGNYFVGSKVYLTEIRTDRDGNVWGHTRDSYWLALLLRGRYYTTWRK